MGNNKGVVFNIQKCSIHDGPGIRTTVFLKGCPLRCQWCANPESQNIEPEVVSFFARCIKCNKCMLVCPLDCISNNESRYEINKNVCTNCGMCADICFAESKQIIGKEMTPEEVLKEILKDKMYFANSKGGVTFSGGEPIIQPYFLAEITKKCHDNQISVAVETCGYGDYDLFSPALDYIDLIYFDLKHTDDEVHKKLTGLSNEIILENLKKINSHGMEIILRVAIIPGYNDQKENLLEVARIALKTHNVKAVELMPYHNLGESKYNSLGRNYELKDVKLPEHLELVECVDAMKKILDSVGKICFFDGGQL